MVTTHIRIHGLVQGVGFRASLATEARRRRLAGWVRNRRDGTVEEADTCGTLIGVLPAVTSRTAQVRLTPGETCLLFTDGVTEAKGGPLGDTMFGEERLKRAMAECAGMPAEAVVERVQMIVSQWIGHRRHDDIAVMAITAPRGAPPGAVDGASRGRFTA